MMPAIMLCAHKPISCWVVLLGLRRSCPSSTDRSDLCLSQGNMSLRMDNTASERDPASTTFTQTTSRCILSESETKFDDQVRSKNSVKADDSFPSPRLPRLRRESVTIGELQKPGILSKNCASS
ncbi:hypothetical protein BGW80DRAFT_1315414 [Lactifluus volemus]|nr:hypothetical protein BGW80DRAFT_1315414 [Lactifluus volemus]